MTMLSSLCVAYATYVIGTASPGPANLAITNNALRYGRSGGMATALGVVTGSVTWGLVSALGLGAALAAWPNLLHALSLLGGCYLLWLAWASARTVLKGNRPELGVGQEAVSSQWRGQFLYGLGLHLINPKAMFVWMSIIALGLPADAEGLMPPLLVVVGCAVLGILVFCSYAFVFSIPVMIQIYFRASRAINLLIGALFGAAGLSLLYRSADVLLSAATASG